MSELQALGNHQAAAQRGGRLMHAGPAFNWSALFALAAAGSSALTWIWIGFARRRQIHDLPGQRRLHGQPTPRGGGIAIALVCVAAFAWLASRTPTASPELVFAALGMTLFAGIGLLDDLVPVRALAKLALQLAAAAVLVFGISHDWPLWMLATSAFLTVVCAYFVNCWNFMDGSNGMIATQSLVICLALAVRDEAPATLRLAALATAGACVGFLPFNLPRARVFLGDVGSHVLGAAVFALLLLMWHATDIGVREMLMGCSAVLIDTGLTLLRRLLAGRKVWHAHREHLYQIAVRKGHSHGQVCFVFAAWTLVWAALAQLFHSYSSFVMSILFILCYTCGAALYFGLRWIWLRPTRRGSAVDDMHRMLNE